MTTEHPITPPWALIAKWRKEWTTNTSDRLHQCNYVANQAARWGADQLRAARRSKSPRSAEEALNELDLVPTHDQDGRSIDADTSVIRRALERLQELEGTMTDLSPAAQAVLDAATPALNNLDACGFNHQRYDRKALAAVLRAAADQIEPDDGVSTEVRQVLNKLLAIADELENHQ